MSVTSNTTNWNAWPHRAAVVLTCATFPLIWIGGLVTTYDAGMAVPDWPSTYGYNLFLYPWSTWLAGPWDLLIEHGHRLLAAAVGIIAICTLVITWKYERRRWVRCTALGALALVILQGALGGARVLLDDRQIAQVHGIVGPIFFALTVFLAAATSSWWASRGDDKRLPVPSTIATAAWFAVALALFQLIIGSQLRHVSGISSRQLFALALTMHLVVALILLVHSAILSWRIARLGNQLVRGPGIWLSLLIVGQIALGVATWIFKYGIPSILQPIIARETFIVEAQGLLASTLATAHVANGALILATSLLIALRATRDREAERSPARVQSSISVGASL